MVFDEDEAPQKEIVANKNEGRSQAGEMEQERRTRDREGSSRQDRRLDKNRDVYSREHEPGHHSRRNREFERPRADKYRDRSAERVSDRDRGRDREKDTSRHRSDDYRGREKRSRYNGD